MAFSAPAVSWTNWLGSRLYKRCIGWVIWLQSGYSTCSPCLSWYFGGILYSLHYPILRSHLLRHIHYQESCHSTQPVMLTALPLFGRHPWTWIHVLKLIMEVSWSTCNLLCMTLDSNIWNNWVGPSPFAITVPCQELSYLVPHLNYDRTTTGLSNLHVWHRTTKMNPLLYYE